MDGTGDNLDEAGRAAEIKDREQQRLSDEARKTKAEANLAEYNVDRMRWRFRMEVSKVALMWLGFVVAFILALDTLSLIG